MNFKTSTPRNAAFLVTSLLVLASGCVIVDDVGDELGNDTTGDGDGDGDPAGDGDGDGDTTGDGDGDTTGDGDGDTTGDGDGDGDTGCVPMDTPVEDEFDGNDLDPERWYAQATNGIYEVEGGAVTLLQGDDLMAASHLVLKPGNAGQAQEFPTEAFSISMDFACPGYGWCSTGLQFNDPMSGNSILIRAELSVDPAYTSFHIVDFGWGGTSPSISNVALDWDSSATMQVTYDPMTAMIEATLVDSDGVLHMLSTAVPSPPPQHTVSLQIDGDAPDPGVPVGRIDSVTSTFEMEVPCD